MLNFLTQLSQSHTSLSYRLVYLFFIIFIFQGWFWIPISLFFAYLAGFIERKFINKKLDKAPSNVAVVITGCSSGFGYTLAKRLADNGVYVFAGVRKDDDANKLKQATTNSDNMHPIILDVTNDDHILAAKTEVEQTLTDKGLKLWSLVNNAGYAVYGPIEAIGTERIQKMYNVNVFGLITVTQAFIPLLRKYKLTESLNSRIINISSIGGLISFPSMGQYCSTKYALEAISDSLRMELKPWNISVCIVEPGAFKTEFQGKAYADLQCDSFNEITGELYDHYNSLIKSTNENSVKKNRPTQDKCVDVIEHALYDTKPLARYRAGPDCQLAIPLLKNILVNETLTDLIQGKGWNSLKKQK